MPGIGGMGRAFGGQQPQPTVDPFAGSMAEAPFIINRPQSNVPVAPPPRSSFAPVDQMPDYQQPPNFPPFNGEPQTQMTPEMQQQLQQMRQFLDARGIDANKMRSLYEQMMGGQPKPQDIYRGM